MSESSLPDLVPSLATLEKEGKLTPTSIAVPEGTSYDALVGLLEYFGKVHGAVRWYIGDLLAWSEKRFGEDKMVQAADATGLSEKTLLHYLRVAGRVSPARRRANLSFSIHSEVASLSPSLQQKWLKLAEQKRWSVRELRHLLRDEGVIEQPGSRPQWTPGALSGEAGNGAQGDPATGMSLPSETAPASPSSESIAPRRIDRERFERDAAALEVILVEADRHAWTLSQMRDDLERLVDEMKSEADVSLYETRRDALNWALASLAPELA